MHVLKNTSPHIQQKNKQNVWNHESRYPQHSTPQNDKIFADFGSPQHATPQNNGIFADSVSPQRQTP